jgi:hypothetical protein
MVLAQQPPRQKTRTADFETAGFKVPFAVVLRSEGARGTLDFTRSPRICFGWQKALS